MALLAHLKKSNDNHSTYALLIVNVNAEIMKMNNKIHENIVSYAESDNN
jgi:hypothetical protein